MVNFSGNVFLHVPAPSAMAQKRSEKAKPHLGSLREADPNSYRATLHAHSKGVSATLGTIKSGQVSRTLGSIACGAAGRARSSKLSARMVQEVGDVQRKRGKRAAEISHRPSDEMQESFNDSGTIANQMRVLAVKKLVAEWAQTSVPVPHVGLEKASWKSTKSAEASVIGHSVRLPPGKSKQCRGAGCAGRCFSSPTYNV